MLDDRAATVHPVTAVDVGDAVDVPDRGAVDVAVTDGFTGNVMLKSSEAVAKLLVDKIKEAIKQGGPLAMLGGLLVT